MISCGIRQIRASWWEKHPEQYGLLVVRRRIQPEDLADVTETVNKANPVVKIGIAYDGAFCFYYPENFAALEKAGAELVFFAKDQ